MEGSKFMSISSRLKFILIVIVVTSLMACAESSFSLAPESRLPKWFEIPKGRSRNELKVTMDYYVYPGRRIAVFKFYEKGQFVPAKKVTGNVRGSHPLEPKNPPSGFPEHYPSYEIITVNGITDIIEHRKMEPIFYLTDDAAIWKELGVEQK